MGAEFVTEKSALLGAESLKKHVDVESGDGAEREWLGSWYNCFGDCGRASWLACCVTTWVPFVSSGFSVRRGLRDNIFLHMAFFLVCFMGVHYAGGRVQNTHMGNYEVQCAQQILLEENQNRLWMQAELPAVCNPLIPWVIGRYIADLAAFIVGVAYLARRRTLLRRKFGIAGSSFRDFCLYFWCPKCAICQEYRTMVHNNVHDGVWHGKVIEAPNGAMYKAPVDQAMV